jgi:hypothetical protein
LEPAIRLPSCAPKISPICAASMSTGSGAFGSYFSTDCCQAPVGSPLASTSRSRVTMTASPVALRVVPNEWLMTSPVGLYSVCSQTISPNGFGGGTLTSVRQPFMRSSVALIVAPTSITPGVSSPIVCVIVNVDKSVTSMRRLSK